MRYCRRALSAGATDNEKPYLQLGLSFVTSAGELGQRGKRKEKIKKKAKPISTASPGSIGEAAASCYIIRMDM